MGPDFSSRPVGRFRAGVGHRARPRGPRDDYTSDSCWLGWTTRAGISRQTRHMAQLRNVNVFQSSVYGQQGGERHKNDPGIIAYRNRWLDALLIGHEIEAVVAFGELAGGAWKKWKATPKGQSFEVAAVKVPHPTYPESAFSNNEEKRKAATKAMLIKWNAALNTLRTAITHPDEPTSLA